MTREEAQAVTEKCHAEVVAVLKKYNCKLTFTQGSAYGGNGGHITLKSELGTRITGAAIDIHEIDYSM